MTLVLHVAHRWGTIGVHHVTHVDGVPSVCITSAGVISGGHGRHIVPDPGDAGSQSQQHSTFKVKLGESDSVPRPPVPGSADNHARSVAGSNGSARLRTTPSPTMGPPHRVVDEDRRQWWGGRTYRPVYLSGRICRQAWIARPRTASVHSIASPGPRMRGARHDTLPPPPSTTRFPPVSTTAQRLLPPYRPRSSLPPPSSPQSVQIWDRQPTATEPIPAPWVVAA
ncbi:hypothetical protein FRC12_024765 [Ceratobasidium sp. 428]|nr:hypothetical protein FRC12_024765 [Ceratobasidium sp. 428]